MKPHLLVRMSLVVSFAAGLILLAGCQSTPRTVSEDGREYRRTENLDKVWMADGFDLTQYDAVVVVPTTVAQSVQPKDEKEADRLASARNAVARDFVADLQDQQVFKSVVTQPSEIKPEEKALRLETTILKFSRGSSAARYGIGFGAGMPYIQIRGQFTPVAGGEPVMIFEIDETADWFGAGFSSSKTLQSHAAMELADDVVTFLSRLSRHEPVKYK